MHRLLFKTPEFAFLDYKLFEELPLPDFHDISNGYNMAERLVAAAPVLAKAVAWAARLAKACRCQQELRVFGFDPQS